MNSFDQTSPHNVKLRPRCHSAWCSTHCCWRSVNLEVSIRQLLRSFSSPSCTPESAAVPSCPFSTGFTCRPSRPHNLPHLIDPGMHPVRYVVETLKLMIQVLLARLSIWTTAHFTTLQGGTSQWENHVIDTVDFLQHNVLQVPFFLMNFIKFLSPALDNMCVSLSIHAYSRILTFIAGSWSPCSG